MSIYDDMKERKKEEGELLLSENYYKYTKKRN